MKSGDMVLHNNEKVKIASILSETEAIIKYLDNWCRKVLINELQPVMEKVE